MHTVRAWVTHWRRLVVSAAVGCVVAVAALEGGPAGASSVVPSVVASVVPSVIARAEGPGCVVVPVARVSCTAGAAGVPVVARDKDVGGVAGATGAPAVTGFTRVAGVEDVAGISRVVAVAARRVAPSPVPGERPVAPVLIPPGAPFFVVQVGVSAWLALVAILVAHMVWRRRRDRLTHDGVRAASRPHRD